MSVAQSTPAVYWDALPLDQLEAWVRANTPTGVSDTVGRSMEGARFLSAQKKSLVKAADAYLAGPSHAALIRAD
jgi:aminopeptidase N